MSRSTRKHARERSVLAYTSHKTNIFPNTLLKYILYITLRVEYILIVIIIITNFLYKSLL